MTPSSLTVLSVTVVSCAERRVCRERRRNRYIDDDNRIGPPADKGVMLKFTLVERRTVDKNSICQFTGLYDKNGKEIYEGDIVFNPHDKYGYYDINWCNEVSGFCLGIDGNNLYQYCLSEFWEVVGNIHDGTELLTKEKL